MMPREKSEIRRSEREDSNLRCFRGPFDSLLLAQGRLTAEPRAEIPTLSLSKGRDLGREDSDLQLAERVGFELSPDADATRLRGGPGRRGSNAGSSCQSDGTSC